MKVAEAIRSGSATLKWPRGGFDHPNGHGGGSATPGWLEGWLNHPHGFGGGLATPHLAKEGGLTFPSNFFFFVIWGMVEPPS